MAAEKPKHITVVDTNNQWAIVRLDQVVMVAEHSRPDVEPITARVYLLGGFNMTVPAAEAERVINAVGWVGRGAK